MWAGGAILAKLILCEGLPVVQEIKCHAVRKAFHLDLAACGADHSSLIPTIPGYWCELSCRLLANLWDSRAGRAAPFDTGNPQETASWQLSFVWAICFRLRLRRY